MKIVLDYWQIRWRSVLFDTSTGTGTVKWFSKKPKVCRGWTNRFRGKWYALWNSPMGLVFQAGNKRWNMEDFSCLHKINGPNCVFEIYRSGVLELSVKYDLSQDIMLDELDLEIDDFFLWVSKIWNDSALKLDFISSWDVALDAQGISGSGL